MVGDSSKTATTIHSGTTHKLGDHHKLGDLELKFDHASDLSSSGITC